MRKKIISLLFIVLFISCKKESIEDLSSLEDKLTIDAISSNSLSSKAALGKAIYFDNLFSEPQVQSCASCHIPQSGFSGLRTAATGGVAQGFISGMAEGAFRGRFGGRIPPSAAYATFSPNFGVIPGEDGEFRGGLFWDGRATGLVGKGSPAAEQALGPLLSNGEHNNGTALVVLNKIKSSQTYLTLWNNAFGTTAISTSSNTDINSNFNKVGEAIAAYEASSEVNQFSSKYDAFLRGEASLTPSERRGLALFNGDAKCFKCHLSEGNSSNPPLFTDFKYYNLGISINPLNPVYTGTPNFRDLGLGGFLSNQTINSTWKAAAGKNNGKFKTPTVRNAAKSNNRAYMHNGIFNSLEQVIDFYNMRDESKASGRWGRPEVGANIQKGWLGNLNLTQSNIQDLVAFIKTLNDGYTSASSTVSVH